MADLSQKEIDKKVSKRLNLGLLNKWYPVLPSYKVQNEPVGITRLSEKIVYCILFFWWKRVLSFWLSQTEKTTEKTYIFL